jgi:hypothetical protein
VAAVDRLLGQLGQRRRGRGRRGRGDRGDRKGRGDRQNSSPSPLGRPSGGRPSGEELLALALLGWGLAAAGAGADAPNGPNPNRSLDQTLERLDRRFRGCCWWLRLELRPPLAAAAERPGGPAALAAVARRRGLAPPLAPLLQRALTNGWLRPDAPAPADGLAPAAGRPSWQPLGQQLANLLLAPVDRWGLALERRLRRGERRRRNPAYDRLRQLEQLRQERGWERLPAVATGRGRPFRAGPGEEGLSGPQLRRRLATTPVGDPLDPGYRRVVYLRHGTSLLLGVAGPLPLARRLGLELGQRLARAGLPLPEGHSLRPRPARRPLPLLGYRLRPGVRGRRLRLEPPLPLLLERLGRWGFLRRRGGSGPGRRWHPCRQRRLLRRPAEAIGAAYGRLWDALTAYYGPPLALRGGPWGGLRRLGQRLERGLRLTLAAQRRQRPEVLSDRWGVALLPLPPAAAVASRRPSGYPGAKADGRRPPDFGALRHRSLAPLAEFSGWNGAAAVGRRRRRPARSAAGPSPQPPTPPRPRRPPSPPSAALRRRQRWRLVRGAGALRLPAPLAPQPPSHQTLQCPTANPP